MKTVRELRLTVGLVVLLSTMVITPVAEAQPTIHALLIIMGGSGDAGRYEADYKRVQGLFYEVQDLGICKLDIKALKFDHVKQMERPWPRPILDWVKKVNPGSDDVIFVYFTGHGNRENNRWDDGTYLKLPGTDKIFRNDLVDAMKSSGAWNCRLKILITDSCSGPGANTALLGTSSTSIDGEGPAAVRRQLFVEHEGFLHIASASPGEVAFVNSKEGGFFTMGLIQAINSQNAAEGFVGWHEVFTDASEHVKKLVDEITPEHRERLERKGITMIQQNPKAYELPQRLNRPLTITHPDTSPDGMVLIPAGEFQMGSDYFEDHKESEPIHSVYLDAFYIDTHEVTVGEYKQFLRATLGEAYRLSPLLSLVAKYSPTDEHPIVSVSWHEAMAYAKWAGKRLPTEAEWEKAARGPEQFQHYPWEGEEIGSSQANYGGTYGEILPVGTFDPYGYGLHDMAGNVAEWCLDPFFNDFYDDSPPENPFAGRKSRDETIANFESVKGNRVFRGGAWDSPGISVRVDLRSKEAIHDEKGIPRRYNTVGFRCVKDAQ